jgi:hypothetical protein
MPHFMSDAVQIYHDLFYDVEPRLGDASFVARMALNWYPRPDYSDYMGALGVFGYSLGGRAVDALLHYFIAPSNSGVYAGEVSGATSEKLRCEKLFEQASRVSYSLVGRAIPYRLLSVVTLLREDGASLVADGVDVPVLPPPKDPPVPSLGLEAWFESMAQDRYEPLMVPLLRMKKMIA